MRIGVVFPQLDIGQDPKGIRDFAQAAEELGYSHILCFDHVLGARHDGRSRALFGPYDELSAFHEPLTLFAHLAGVTKRIEFATGVLVLPQRQTALVAKQAAEVAILSGNRLRLGVGIGWNFVEYEVLGEDFSNRGLRVEEQISVMRHLWSQDVVDLRGQWHVIDRAGINPRPDRSVPIWIGGGPRARTRAAAMADGFTFFRENIADDADPRESAVAMVEAGHELRDEVAGLGRDPALFGLEGRTHFNYGPKHWVSEAECFRGAAFDYLCVNLMNSGLTGPAKLLGALERYATEVGLTRDFRPGE